MSTIMEIVHILIPLLIVCGIAIFVVYRMKYKYEQSKLGKKKSPRAQHVLDSLIPLGMILGCIIGIIFSMFLPATLLLGVSLGAGIGLLFGYVSYEIYSKQGNDYS